MRRWFFIAVLVPGLLLVGQAPASAHAELVSSTPANGSTIARWPNEFRLVFSEPVQLVRTRVLDARGQVVPAPAVASEQTLRLSPTRRSSRAATVSWSVVSGDGHVIDGSSSFWIGAPSKPGPQVALSTIPAVRASIDGIGLGRRTVTITSKATAGDVAWSHPALLGPIRTPIIGAGGKARSSAVLGLPGTWTLEMTLVNPDYSVIVVHATVQVQA